MLRCELCPKLCQIAPGQSGDCRVRINDNGVLRSVVYGFPCALHTDPVEKKPLFHFMPGSEILSIATVGCNLHCLNCQNWEISQANPEDSQAMALAPERLVELATQERIPSIAYTYTDPVIYYEYALDSARLAREKGIKNALVTAAYINPQPWRQLLDTVDAANIDLKFMDDALYQTICTATLKPVQQALVMAKEQGVWVEVTNLVIPTLNDSPNQLRSLARWIKQNLDAHTPLHFSAFTPRYQMRHLPSTSAQSLERAREIALAEGLHYVYIGNVYSEQGQNTFCPACKGLLIERSGFRIMQNRMDQGRCDQCQHPVKGVWS
jgi:pyruvate formate lyase activating enzyme